MITRSIIVISCTSRDIGAAHMPYRALHASSLVKRLPHPLVAEQLLERGLGGACRPSHDGKERPVLAPRGPDLVRQAGS